MQDIVERPDWTQTGGCCWVRLVASAVHSSARREEAKWRKTFSAWRPELVSVVPTRPFTLNHFCTEDSVGSDPMPADQDGASPIGQ